MASVPASSARSLSPAVEQHRLRTSSGPEQPVASSDFALLTRLLRLRQSRCERYATYYAQHPTPPAWDQSKLSASARAVVVDVSTAFLASQADSTPTSDVLLLRREPVTVFHASLDDGGGGGTSLGALIGSIARHSPHVGHPNLTLAALVLFDRFEATTGLRVTTAMMHRLLVACLLVASKTLDDAHVSVRRLAGASGMPPYELGHLEAALLKGLEWRSLVTAVDVRSHILSYDDTNEAHHSRHCSPVPPESHAAVRVEASAPVARYVTRLSLPASSLARASDSVNTTDAEFLPQRE